MTSTAVASPDVASSAPSSGSASSSSFRPDIQGLRALAVGLVVLYHLFPRALPGGYVGVDVFFVISGFLITSHLARTLRKTGTVSLVDFYASRARRLMPAAVLVLTVTWIVSLFVLPTTQLSGTAEQVRASALYVENWLLADNAVTYLKSDAAASPVQHFWSLSVEEQFYLIWPILFIIAGVVGFRLSRRARPEHRAHRRTNLSLATLALGAGAVFSVSLSYSIYETWSNPPAAYFITPTRMWELALGGLVAMLPPAIAATRFPRRLLVIVGLAMIVTAAFVLDASSRFPGAVALWPVVGAALMIVGGTPGRVSGALPMMMSRPVVFVGDISYSLYLWHWPVIVLYLAWFGGTIGALDGPIIAVISVALAWLTKRYVEDIVRLSALMRRSARLSLATLLAIAVPVGLTSGWLLKDSAEPVATADTTHPGAAVLAGASAAPDYAQPIPTFERAAHDYGAYGDGPGGCQSEQSNPDETLCYFGETKSPTKTIALVGDSVAATWFDDLNAIATERGWRLVTDLHSLCPWTSAMGNTPYTSGKPYTSCHAWGQQVMTTMLTKVKPDVVITSARPAVGTIDHPTPGPAAFSQIGNGMAEYWQQLIDNKIAVVAIREPPEMGIDIPDCLSRPRAEPADCAVPADRAIVADSPVVVAARQLPESVTYLDLNTYICGKKICEPIVGNVVVYIDQHHITSTYASTIRPYLEGPLTALPELRR